MMSTTTILIIVATCVISAAAMERQNLLPESLQRPEWTGLMKLNPYLVWHKRQIYRILTHGLVHADLWHLAFNMLTLHFFGPYVDTAFQQILGPTSGKLAYIILYISALAISSSADLLRHKDNPGYSAIGASGAVSAVLFASILLFPTARISLLFIPIPTPGWLFGILYLAYCFYMARRGRDNIGHTAHAMGAIYGFLFPILLHSGTFGHFLKQLGIM